MFMFSYLKAKFLVIEIIRYSLSISGKKKNFPNTNN